MSVQAKTMASDGATLLLNPSLDRALPYSAALRDILSLAALDKARAAITAWDGYAPTPVHDVTTLAKSAAAQILYKDEGFRFALKSFKALGGAFAVERLAKERGAADFTVACATDGNHGRAVAWGAQRAGANAVVYIHKGVSQGRADAIAAFGAEVRRIDGSYDDSVRQAAKDAETNSWTVVSDTSWPGYMEIPKLVMQGYALMMREAWDAGARPTHVFAQGGVGGLAAAILSWLWETLGAERPIFVVVEPEKAACLYESARNRRLTTIAGDLSTIMAGLECGEPSPLAWEILAPGADVFMTLSDARAEQAMRDLARLRIVGGESGVAGLAAALATLRDPAMRGALRLTPASRILCFGTEGATDPEVYRRIVGQSVEEVRAGVLS